MAAATSQLGHYGAVTAAFETYHAELYSFLRRSTRDEAAAEDLLQEAFLRLTREVEAGRTPEHIRGWLYRVGSNLAISRGRRRMTAFDWMNRYGRTEHGDDVESPESGVLAARTALLLSADGFSGEEIAATIGRSHAATRTLISRARVRVRLELERTGDVR